MKAIVTGADEGIGRGLVEAFGAAGYEVVATDIGDCDLADPAAIARFCEGMEGPVHALVNNAGIANWPRPIAETSLEDWDRVLAVNLRAPFLLVKGLLDKFAPEASVVNISSVHSAMTNDANEPYAASKAGMIGLTQAMAVSLGRSHRIRVNAISPGYIAHGDMRPSEEEHRIHPMGRVGRPSDIGGIAVWLCSPAAEFVTGAEWIVDGGMHRVMAYPE